MNIADPVFSRSLGFISETEQQQLIDSSVAIAGAGGDGGMLAVALARYGVGELRLADPDPFEDENINRQACCTTETVGVNKAIAVGEYVNRINPEIKVQVYDDGINRDNVHDFVSGADLVIDETEFTIHTLGVILARAAREENIPNLMAMNVGFGATVTSFVPNGMTFEKMLGFSEKDDLEDIEKSNPAISRWLPYIPPYADLKVFEKVASGEKSAPSNVTGVAMATGIASTQAFLHLVSGQNNRPSPITAPDVLMMDAYTGESRRLKLNRRTHCKTLAKMVLRNQMSRNPTASY